MKLIILSYYKAYSLVKPAHALVASAQFVCSFLVFLFYLVKGKMHFTPYLSSSSSSS